MRYIRITFVCFSLWFFNSLAAQFAAAEEVYKTDFLYPKAAIVLDPEGSGAGDVLIYGDQKIRLYRNGSPPNTVVETCINSNTIQAQAVGDIDGDGLDDIVVANTDVSNTPGLLDIVWYRNLGNAIFSSGTHVYTGDLQTVTIKISDMDGDGNNDLVVGWKASDNVKTINWFQQLPDTTFGSRVILLDNIANDDFAIDDMDGDGDEDIVTAGSTSYVWYREEDGTYSTGSDLNMTSGRKVGIHDIDMDGAPDIFIQTMTHLFMLRNEGNDDWGYPQNMFLASIGSGFADINGDGLIDVWGANSESFTNAKTLSYKLADGAGGLLPTVVRSSGAGAFTPAWTDISGDGVYDLISIGNIWSNTVGYYTSTGFTPITRTMKSATGLCVADIDGDGEKDIFAMSHQDSKVSWLENLGNGKWSEHVIWYSPFNNHYYPFNYVFPALIVPADADGNGTMDLLLVTQLVTDNYACSAQWFLNDGTGAFSVGPNLQNFPSSYNMGSSVAKVKDIDQDGVVDVISFNLGAFYWLGIQGGGFEDRVQISINPGYNCNDGDVGDVDGDGDLDIVCNTFVGPGEKRLAIVENLGSNVFGTPEVIPGGLHFNESIMFWDIDEDGDLDILASKGQFNGVGWFENVGGQFVGPHMLGPYRDLMLFDFDQDGDLDLAANLGDYYNFQFHLFENAGAGQFLTPSVINPSGALAAVAEDMDGDGYPDLVISHDPNTISMYRNLGEWLTTSIGDDKALPKARVYPNPATSWVRVEVPNGQIQRWGLFDSMGRFISEGADLTGGVHEFSRRGLASSLYFLRPLDGSILDKAAYPVVFE